MKEVIYTEKDVAGALYDFAASMTTHNPSIEVGYDKVVSPVLDQLTEWAKKRNLNLDEANVTNWNVNEAKSPLC